MPINPIAMHNYGLATPSNCLPAFVRKIKPSSDEVKKIKVLFTTDLVFSKAIQSLLITGEIGARLNPRRFPGFTPPL